MKIDFTVSLGDLVVFVGSVGALVPLGFAVLRRLDRILGFLKDYPPHRHVADKILYPPEYTPAPMEELDHKKVTA